MDNVSALHGQHRSRSLETTGRWREVLALGEAPIKGRTVVSIAGRQLLVASRFRPALARLLEENPPVERAATIASFVGVLEPEPAAGVADQLLSMVHSRAAPATAWRSWWRGFIQVPIWRPSQRVVDALRGRVLTPVTLTLWAAGVLAALLSLVVGGPLPALARPQGLGWLELWVLMTTSTCIHELGHFSVAAHYGVRARSVGVGLFYIQPAGYADISDAWLVRRRSRVAITLGGLLFQTVPVIAAYVAWRLTESRVLGWYSFVSLGLMAFNLIPFVRLDGYWALSFCLDEHNLRQRAFQELIRIAVPSTPASGWHDAEAVLALVFALMSVIFTVGMYVAGLMFIQAVAPSPIATTAPWIAIVVVLVILSIAGVRIRAWRGFLRSR